MKKLAVDVLPFVETVRFSTRAEMLAWYDRVFVELNLEETIDGGCQATTLKKAVWDWSSNLSVWRRGWLDFVLPSPRLKFFAAGSDIEIGSTLWEFVFRAGTSSSCRLVLAESEKEPAPESLLRIRRICRPS